MANNESSPTSPNGAHLDLSGLQLPPEMEDGFQLHAAMLSHGLDTVLLPRQLLLGCVAGGTPGEVAFVHGVPNSSTLAAVSFAHDKRVRRALLERAGIPVPKGATFSIRGYATALRFAKRIGYPVMLREALGENPGRMMTDIRDADELLTAFDALRLVPEQSGGTASDLARSAYGRYGLSAEEIDDDGRRLAPSGTRFLLEKMTTGQRLCCLATTDAVLLIVHVQNDPLRPEVIEQDVTQRVHGDIRDAAMQSVRAVPGLSVGVIDLVVEDMTSPTSKQAWSVVDCAERPHLADLLPADKKRRLQIANLLLSREFSPIRNTPQSESINVTLTASGVPDASAAIAKLQMQAKSAGIETTWEVSDPVEGAVSSTFASAPTGIAAFSEALVSGLLSIRAMVVETRQA